MTYHSICRTEERANLSKGAAMKMIERASKKGRMASEFALDERRYLQSKENEGRYACYYSGYCFIFTKGHICITMFPVPKWFGKRGKYNGKILIREPKKYLRIYGGAYDTEREIQQYC